MAFISQHARPASRLAIAVSNVTVQSLWFMVYGLWFIKTGTATVIVEVPVLVGKMF